MSDLDLRALLDALARAEEGVRYWTDLAQAEARDAATLRARVAELERCSREDACFHLCGDCGDEPGVVANLHGDVLRAEAECDMLRGAVRDNSAAHSETGKMLLQAEARVTELETVLRDTCREKVLHGHTTTLLTDALRLKVPGVENYEDWTEERESKLQKAEARIKELESVLDGYGARDLQEMSEKLKVAEVRIKNLEAAYAAISPQTIEKWRNGELTAGELISFGHETGLLARTKALEAQVTAARKLAEEFSKDTFDGGGETAAAGDQLLTAMDEATKGIT